MLIETPGIYKGVPNEDYHRSKGISNSGMGLLLPPNCPKLYWYQKLSGKYVRKDTDAFRVGSIVHTLAFEPATFEERYHVVDEIPKRNSNIGKDAHKLMLLEAGNKTVIEKSEIADQQWMAENLTTHAMWQAIKGDMSGNIEDSIMWEDFESGALLRTRPDYYNDEIIIDIKSSKDSTPQSFARALAQYGYHRQAAMACDGLKELTGRTYDKVILFVVDKRPPYFVRCYVLGIADIQQGRDEYKAGAKIYQNCLTSGIWHGYPEIIEDLSLPNWAYRSVEDE